MDLQITLLKEDIVANNQAGTLALCSTWEASNIQQPRGSLAAVPTLPRPGRLVPVPLVAVMLQGFPPSPLPTGKNGLARSSSSQSINLHHSAPLYRIYRFSTAISLYWHMTPHPLWCTGHWKVVAVERAPKHLPSAVVQSLLWKFQPMVDIYIHRIPPSLSDTFSQNSSPGSFLLGKTQMWYVFTETGISACIYQISRIKLGSFLSYVGKKGWSPRKSQVPVGWEC